MESVLNVNVSQFRNYGGTIPTKNISLLDWLQNSSYRDKVERVRLIKDKPERDKLKGTLPCITVSGLFKVRNKGGLIKHTGLMCIDIDPKGNEQIKDLHGLKEMLSTAPYIAYCGLSVSAKGVYAIIPLLYPDKHEAHFKALQKIFAGKGIVIDTSCRDVTRLRGYSWDDSPYINHNAELFTDVIEPIPRPVKKQRGNSVGRSVTKRNVEQCIDIITENCIDITENREHWLGIGFALSNEFGEDGREYFHQVSQYHAEYDFDESEIKYSDCLENNRHEVNMGTFFHYCKEAGIVVNGYKTTAIEDFIDFCIDVEQHEC